MEEVTIGGTILLPVGATICDVTFINWNNRSWLVPVWMQSPDGKIRRPLRLVGPRFAPGHTCPPGPDVLEIFQQIILPRSVLEQGHIPPELKPAVEIIENPAIFVTVSATAH